MSLLVIVTSSTTTFANLTITRPATKTPVATNTRTGRPTPTNVATVTSPPTSTSVTAPTVTLTPTVSPTDVASLTPTATPLPTITQSPTSPPPTPSSGTFIETFDGQPTSPLPWPEVSAFDNWDVTVHRRSTALVVEGINAHHGPDCSSPDNTHYNTTYEGSVFQCNDHVMTAINDEGYGAVYLTPNHIVDFSNGEAVIRFDMSTLKTSTRDWISLWITPYDENLQLPIDFEVDLQGQPNNTIQLLLLPEMAFIPRITRNGTTTDYRYATNWWTGYDDFLIPDAARRDTFELRISQNSLKFCMPDYDFCWINMPINPPLTWNQGIFQFEHASYTPTKDGAGIPNTWHLDNVEISPSIPFTIIKANKRYVNTTNSDLQFNSPAPTNAYLRFAAIGSNVQVSFNNGRNWVNAQKNPQGNNEYHFSSYWTPIPQGITQVKFRAEGYGINNEAWQARDITVWSKEIPIVKNTNLSAVFNIPSEAFCQIP